MVDTVDINSIQYLSFLLSDIDQTKSYLSVYNNVYLQTIASIDLSGLTKTQAKAKIKEQTTATQKEHMAQAVASFRSYATRAYINFKSISNNFLRDDQTQLIKVIDDSFYFIQTETFPDLDIAFKFVQAINDLFIKEIKVDVFINTRSNMVALANTGQAPQV